MGTIDVRVARTLVGEDRARFVRIYEDSFPPSERDPANDLLSRIKTGNRVCYIVSISDVLVGLAVVLPLSSVDMSFLEYFAIEATWRSKGIGSRFLRELATNLQSGRLASSGMLFEVESPDLAEGAEHTLRQRRIQFYRRNGAAMVDCAPRYRAPNLEQKGTVPYALMWSPLRPGVPQLGGDLLRRAVSAILTESYELRSDDPLVANVVADLTC